MAFSINCLTYSGTQLLAQASAANPIVYIGAVASTNSYDEATLQQMSSTSDSRWDVDGGVIIASSATGNTARIIAGFRNRASEATIKTIGITARLSSAADGDEIVLASVSDTTASIRIPSTAEPPVTIEAALNIAVSDALSVTVTSSTAGSAMLSDLDRLVSCHKAGQPETGERQTIYGVKEFRNTVSVGNDQAVVLKFEAIDGIGTITGLNSVDGYSASINFYADERERIEVSASGGLCPGEDVQYNLGGQYLRWNTLYVGNIGTQDACVTAVNTAKIAIHTDDLKNILTIDGNGMASTASIKSAGELSVQSDESIRLYSVGTITLSCDESVVVNAPLTADSFSGVLPYATQGPTQGKPDIPIGAIVWIWISGAYSISLGVPFLDTAFTPPTHLAVISSSGATVEGTDLLPPGSKFVPLISPISRSGNLSCAVPCMRIA